MYMKNVKYLYCNSDQTACFCAFRFRCFAVPAGLQEVVVRPQIFSAPVRPRPVGRFTADTNTNGAKVHARFGV